MLKVGHTAHTPHGQGTITEVESTRGSTSYRVSGRGFDVWVDSTKITAATTPEMEYLAGLDATIDPGDPYHVNDNNHTTLPYDPSPQNPVDLFRSEQTILPGQYVIDPDDRLHSSDSLTRKRTDPNRPYPGPNPDLFAKSAGVWGKEDDGPSPHDDPYYEQRSRDLAHEREQDEIAAQHGWRPHTSAFEDDVLSDQGDDEWHDDLPDPVERTFDKDAAYHYGGDDDSVGEEQALSGSAQMNPSSAPVFYPNGEVQGGIDTETGEPKMSMPKLPSADQYVLKGGDYRPAGLSNRYAYIIEAQDYSDVGQFRSDPLGYMQRQAHVLIAGEEEALHHKFADYTNLLDIDPQMRHAAWKDVAAKAKRLRAEGAVHPEDIGPNRIMATVDGDNGTYQTLVLRGPDYAGIGKGANSCSYSCSCQWGKWAFKRQYKFVGRMCSHALASLWELQAHTNKDNPGRFKRSPKRASVVDDFKKWAEDNNDGHMDDGSIQDFYNTTDDPLSKEDVEKLYDYLNEHPQEAPERDYDIPYTFDNDEAYKTADVLRTRPLSLTPDLREVPQNEDDEWTDVTEDDRKTTGPDQIVHFSHLIESLHKEADDGDNSGATPGSGGTSAPLLPGAGKAIGDWWNNLGGPGPTLDSQGNSVAHPSDSTSIDDKPVDMSGASGIGKSDSGSPLSIPEYLNSQQSTNPADVAATVKPTTPAAPTSSSSSSSTGGELPNTESTWNPATQGGTNPETGKWQPSTDTTKFAPSIDQYKVQSGDTLSQIADRSGLSLSDLESRNKNLTDPNMIHPGDTINLGDHTPPAGVTPGASSPSTPPPPSSPPPKTGLPPGVGATPKPATPAVQPPAAPTPPAPPSTGGTPSAIPNPTPLGGGLPGLGFGAGGPLRDLGMGLRGLSLRGHRYAEKSDVDLLNRLRDLSTSPADHAQHMDSYNDEIRDLVDELNDRGCDASFMVASLHQADNPADGDANFFGHSYPNWADEPAQGSGPDPRHYISDSTSYLDAHPPNIQDVTDEQDIVKFNDGRSKPQQGPRHASTYGDYDASQGDPALDDFSPDGGGTDMLASLHYADPMGYDNPNNPAPADWENADILDQVGNQVSQNNGQGAHSMMPGAGNFNGADAASETPEAMAVMAHRTSPSSSLRRAGGGPQRAPRIDPGVRGQQSIRQAAAPPEDFGFDGVPDPESYGVDPTGSDLVANFQRSAAAADLMSNSSSNNSGGMYSDDAIAAHAQAALMKTAGRKFTPQEQRDLEEESHILGARNIPTEADLAGTHYLLGL